MQYYCFDCQVEVFGIAITLWKVKVMNGLTYSLVDIMDKGTLRLVILQQGKSKISVVGETIGAKANH